MKRQLTIEEMSEANTLLQKLVEGVQERWAKGSKAGIDSYEAYEIIEKIHEIITRGEENEMQEL